MAERNLDDWLKDDKTLRRFIEINIDLLSNLAKIGYGEIEHLNLKDGKLLVKKQLITISGAE
jgi:hypothetical protein